MTSIVRGHHGADRGKGLGADAVGRKELAVVRGQIRHFAHAVVHHAHVHARLNLARQYIEHAAPHVALLNDEVFKVDVGFSLFQILQQGGEFLFAGGEVGHGGIAVERKAAAAVEIGAQIVCAGALVLERMEYAPVLRQRAARACDLVFRAGLDGAVSEIRLRKGEQHRARQRQDGDDEHPCELCRRVHVIVEQIYDHRKREYSLYRHEDRDLLCEPVVQGDDKEHLHEQQQCDQTCAAEHGAQKSLLMFFEQMQSAVFFLATHGFSPPLPDDLLL